MVRALEQAQKGFGEGSPHMAAALNNLAEIYRLQKKFGEAEPLYAKVSLIFTLSATQTPATISLTQSI